MPRKAAPRASTQTLLPLDDVIGQLAAQLGRPDARDGA